MKRLILVTFSILLVGAAIAPIANADLGTTTCSTENPGHCVGSGGSAGR